MQTINNQEYLNAERFIESINYNENLLSDQEIINCLKDPNNMDDTFVLRLIEKIQSFSTLTSASSLFSYLFNLEFQLPKNIESALIQKTLVLLIEHLFDQCPTLVKSHPESMLSALLKTDYDTKKKKPVYTSDFNSDHRYTFKRPSLKNDFVAFQFLGQLSLFAEKIQNETLQKIAQLLTLERMKATYEDLDHQILPRRLPICEAYATHATELDFLEDENNTKEIWKNRWEEAYIKASNFGTNNSIPITEGNESHSDITETITAAPTENEIIHFLEDPVLIEYPELQKKLEQQLLIKIKSCTSWLSAFTFFFNVTDHLQPSSNDFNNELINALLQPLSTHLFSSGHLTHVKTPPFKIIHIWKKTTKQSVINQSHLEKNYRFKKTDFAEECITIDTLTQLYEFATAIGHSALQTLTQGLILEKMKATFNSLALQDPEWRQALCEAYIERLPTLPFLETQLDKREEWINQWKIAEEEALHYAKDRSHISQHYFSGMDSLWNNRQDTHLTTLESEKKLYALSQSPDHKQDIADLIIEKIKHAATIKIPLSHCDLVKSEFSTKRIVQQTQSILANVSEQSRFVLVWPEDGDQSHEAFLIDRSQIRRPLKIPLSLKTEEDLAIWDAILNAPNFSDSDMASRRLTKAEFNQIQTLTHETLLCIGDTEEEIPNETIDLLDCELRKVTGPIESTDDIQSLKLKRSVAYVRICHSDRDELLCFTKQGTNTYQRKKIDLSTDELNQFDQHILELNQNGLPTNKILTYPQLQILKQLLEGKHTPPVSEEIIGKKEVYDFVSQEEEYLKITPLKAQHTQKTAQKTIHRYYFKLPGYLTKQTLSKKNDQTDHSSTFLIEESFPTDQGKRMKICFQLEDKFVSEKILSNDDVIAEWSLENTEMSSNLLKATFALYQDIFYNKTLSIETNKTIAYAPDFYLLSQALQSGFHLLAPENKDLNIAQILMNKDEEGINTWMTYLMEKPESRIYLFPGLLKLAYMADALEWFYTKVNQQNQDNVVLSFWILNEHFSNNVNTDDLDIPAIALTLRIIQKDEMLLEEGSLSEHHLTLLQHMTTLFPEGDNFLNYTQILKSMITDHIQDNEETLAKLEKLESLFRLGLTFKNQENFQAFMASDALEISDYLYLKTHKCLTDAQIQGIFDYVGETLETNDSEALTDHLVYLIALYMDEETLIKPYFSKSENNKFEGEKRYLHDLIRKYPDGGRKIIEAAKLLHAEMTDEASIHYALCLINPDSQAYKILTKITHYRTSYQSYYFSDVNYFSEKIEEATSSPQEDQSSNDTSNRSWWPFFNRNVSDTEESAPSIDQTFQ